MIRPPPISPLFPYPTLSRSSASPVRLPQRRVAISDGPLLRQSSSQQVDRKSTRLNSSHGYISYAVFCLKKKKRQNHRRNQLASRSSILCVHLTDRRRVATKH